MVLALFEVTKISREATALLPRMLRFASHAHRHTHEGQCRLKDPPQASSNSLATVTIIGVPVHDRTRSDVVHTFRVWLGQESDRLHHVMTVNPEFIMEARRNHKFRNALLSADLRTADGVGVTLASRLLGKRLPERITGVDMTESLAGLSEPRPRLFLLGGEPGVAAAAARALESRFAGVRIAGTLSGSPNDDDLPDILEQIRGTSADTLLVAFGAPAQDLWIARHRAALEQCGIVIAIGIGGTFDYLSGRVQRAPRLVRRVGLEWLYRLIRQPWRWRRQLVLPMYAMLVLRERLTGKGNSSVGNHGSTKR